MYAHAQAGDQRGTRRHLLDVAAAQPHNHSHRLRIRGAAHATTASNSTAINTDRGTRVTYSAGNGAEVSNHSRLPGNSSSICLASHTEAVQGALAAVVMVTHRRPEYLQRAMQSLLNRTALDPSYR